MVGRTTSCSTFPISLTRTAELCPFLLQYHCSQGDILRAVDGVDILSMKQVRSGARCTHVRRARSRTHARAATNPAIAPKPQLLSILHARSPHFVCSAKMEVMRQMNFSWGTLARNVRLRY